MQVIIDGVEYVPAPKPAEVSTADRIRAVIEQLRSQNTPWPDVAIFLQTWTLQRALSPEEWEVAYAAGFPRELNPAPTPAGDDNDLARPPSLDNSFAFLNTVFSGQKILTGPGRVSVHFNLTDKLGGTIYPLTVTCGEQTRTVSTNGDISFDTDTPVKVTASSPVVMVFRPA